MRPFLLASLVFGVACSNASPPVDAGDDGAVDNVTPPISCAFDFDCPSAGQRCFFPIDGHCTFTGETGRCMDFTQPDACQPNVACGCDGTTISVCAPAGFVDRASNFAGPCPVDAGSNGGADAANE